MTSLQGKPPLVTGASSRPSALSENLSPILADLTEREQITWIFRGLGKIDGLVNCVEQQM